MKATLEYNLPEDQNEFDSANKGPVYKSFIHEFAEYLRNKTKYTDLSKLVTIEEVKDEFWQMLNDSGIEEDF